MHESFPPPGAAEEQAAGGVHEEAGHRDAPDGRAALPDDSQAGGRQAEERRGGRGNMPGFYCPSHSFCNLSLPFPSKCEWANNQSSHIIRISNTSVTCVSLIK
ncbi:hypothetical protein CDAR_178211 [Caerostris darwini]|uniref:Uncharacterized protein n=1 Tax=Caerostris darwini TaxID=1538125 RepID=A0AAV4W350_9ARAC|nr:hypothetical protein CDAR_178211 [Caerostris darwini]